MNYNCRSYARIALIKSWIEIHNLMFKCMEDNKDESEDAVNKLANIEHNLSLIISGLSEKE